MTERTKLARLEAKKCIERCGGTDKVLNRDVNEIMDRTGLDVTEMQNAMSYWKYRRAGRRY